MIDNDDDAEARFRVAYGDWRALADRYGARPLRSEAGSASARHLEETGHQLAFGCCESAAAGAAEDRVDAERR